MDFFHMSIEHRTFVSWRHYFENSGIWIWIWALKFWIEPLFRSINKIKSRLFFRLVKKSNLFSHGETMDSFFTSEKINSFFTSEKKTNLFSLVKKSNLFSRIFFRIFFGFLPKRLEWPNSAKFSVFFKSEIRFFFVSLVT